MEPKQLSKSGWIKVLFAGLCIIVVVSIILFEIFLDPYKVKDSPAPGCIEYIGLLGFSGGCNGKTIIKDFKVEPEISCLNFQINNCGGGILEILNKCGKDLSVGNLDMPYNQADIQSNIRKTAGDFFSIELVKDQTGNINVKEYGANGNYATYTPDKNETLNIDGKIGDQEFTLSYVKTAKLCD